MRLSIEVTSEQHQQLKAGAVLHGQTIKSYVLNRILPEIKTEDEAIYQLEAFLEPRIASKNIVKQSVKQIFEEAYQEMR